MKPIIFLFTRNFEKHQGIRPINIYLLRLLYTLMFAVLGKDVWTYIFTHSGTWEPKDAMAWTVWAAFSALALIGIFRPVIMIPMLLVEVFYKILWLALVALPHWQTGVPMNEETADMTLGFLWIALPIVSIPWGHVVRTYFMGRPTPSPSSD